NPLESLETRRPEVHKNNHDRKFSSIMAERARRSTPGASFETGVSRRRWRASSCQFLAASVLCCLLGAIRPSRQIPAQRAIRALVAFHTVFRRTAQ
ncbi:MAG: hypothetical protein OXF57_12700, partial [Rhodospirillaceae bacterium]|nr:hypothetical protein [Rhodospirillaceae bacterium]